MRNIIYISSQDLEYYWDAEHQMWKWYISCNALGFSGISPKGVYKSIWKYYKKTIYSDFFLDTDLKSKKALHIPKYLTET